MITIDSKKIEGLININYREYQWLQNDGLKDIKATAFAKLKANLVANMFVMPFFVWHKGKKRYILDGKHRKLALEDLEANGYIDSEGTHHTVTIPEELPAIKLKCKDEKEAAQIVLALSSKYAYETDEGLYEFMSEFNLDFTHVETFDFPKISLENFENSYFNTDPEVKQKLYHDGNNSGGIAGNNVLAGGKDSNGGESGENDGLDIKEGEKGKLFDKFIIPPFSILDTRQKYWQDRKRAWIDKGIVSAATREHVETYADSSQGSDMYDFKNKLAKQLGRVPSWDEVIEAAKLAGKSFMPNQSFTDPVLSELMLSWFTPGKGSRVLDTYAGGTSIGAVAGFLEHEFFGMELREEQVIENRKQIEQIFGPNYTRTKYIHADATTVKQHFEDGFQFDIIYSSPPFHDLEVYSDKPEDLSNMSFTNFLETYKKVIKRSVDLLHDNRFAVYVITEIRDEAGFYRNFIKHTIEAFEDAGAKYYNDIVLMNVVGGVATRVGRQFNGGRKVGRVHQNVLVFYKGDPKQIKKNFPALDLGAQNELETNES